jgi:hypothetical protein
LGGSDVKRRVRGVLVITEVYSNGWIVDGLSRVLLTFSILSAYAQVDRGTTWKRPHADLKLSLVSDRILSGCWKESLNEAEEKEKLKIELA